MTRGVYERKIRNVPILCHPEARRHVLGVCINCYSKLLKERNPIYKENQRRNTKERYDRLGTKVINKNNVARQRAYRLGALAKLGNKCITCGYSDLRSLHIDHVNGDGKNERNIRKSINRLIVLGLTDISRYQLLCANCNWIKKVENNE